MLGLLHKDDESVRTKGPLRAELERTAWGSEMSGGGLGRWWVLCCVLWCGGCWGGSAPWTGAESRAESKTGEQLKRLSSWEPFEPLTVDARSATRHLSQAGLGGGVVDIFVDQRRTLALTLHSSARARLWHIPTRRLIREFSERHVQNAHLSPDGNRVALATPTQVSVISTQTGQVERVLKGFGDIEAVSLMPFDGSPGVLTVLDRMAGKDLGFELHRVEVSSGETLHKTTILGNVLPQLASNGWLWAQGEGMWSFHLMFWDGTATNGQDKHVYLPINIATAPYDVALSHDQSKLVMVYDKGVATIDVATETMVNHGLKLPACADPIDWQLSDHGEVVSCRNEPWFGVEVSTGRDMAKEHTAATSSGGGAGHTQWKEAIFKASLAADLSQNTAVEATDVTMAPDAPLLAVTDRHGFVQIWDLERRAEVLSYALDAPVYAAAFSRQDQGRLLGLATDQKLVIVDMASHEVVAERPMFAAEALEDLVFSPDGDQLVASAQHIEVWDIQSGAVYMIAAHAAEGKPDKGIHEQGFAVFDGRKYAISAGLELSEYPFKEHSTMEPFHKGSPFAFGADMEHLAVFLGQAEDDDAWCETLRDALGVGDCPTPHWSHVFQPSNGRLLEFFDVATQEAMKPLVALPEFAGGHARNWKTMAFARHTDPPALFLADASGDLWTVEVQGEHRPRPLGTLHHEPEWMETTSSGLIATVDRAGIVQVTDGRSGQWRWSAMAIGARDLMVWDADGLEGTRAALDAYTHSVQGMSPQKRRDHPARLIPDRQDHIHFIPTR